MRSEKAVLGKVQNKELFLFFFNLDFLFLICRFGSFYSLVTTRSASLSGHCWPCHGGLCFGHSQETMLCSSTLWFLCHCKWELILMSSAAFSSIPFCFWGPWCWGTHPLWLCLCSLKSSLPVGLALLLVLVFGWMSQGSWNSSGRWWSLFLGPERKSGASVWVIQVWQVKAGWRYSQQLEMQRELGLFRQSREEV